MTKLLKKKQLEKMMVWMTQLNLKISKKLMFMSKL